MSLAAKSVGVIRLTSGKIRKACCWCDNSGDFDDGGRSSGRQLVEGGPAPQSCREYRRSKSENRVSLRPHVARISRKTTVDFDLVNGDSSCTDKGIWWCVLGELYHCRRGVCTLGSVGKGDRAT